MHGNGMTIIQVKEPERLQPYLDSWRELLDTVSQSSTVFMTPSWVLSWWKCFGEGKQLSMLLLMSEDRLLGIAPLTIAEQRTFGYRSRLLRFLGTGVSDHLDFCFRPEYQRDGLRHVLDYVMTALDWDVMDLVDIPEDSATIPVLEEALTRHGLLSVTHPSILCPYLPINGETWQKFYASKRSKSTRQDLTRRFRRLGELGKAEFRRYEDPVSIQQVFPQLLAVYRKRWDQKYLSVSFAGRKESAFYVEMALEMCRDDQLHLLTLELDGRVIAFDLSARKNDRFTWLITAYDPEFDKYFPGELILTRLLEEVFDSGRFREFDFTRGDEPYKFKWTQQARYNLLIIAANRGLLPKVDYLARYCFVVARGYAKQSALLRRVKLDLLGKVKALGRQSGTRGEN